MFIVHSSSMESCTEKEKSSHLNVFNLARAPFDGLNLNAVFSVSSNSFGPRRVE